MIGPEDDNFLVAVLIFVVILITIAILGGILEKSDKESCSEIGGKYQVVVERQTGKGKLNVWGCVK